MIEYPEAGCRMLRIVDPELDVRPLAGTERAERPGPERQILAQEGLCCPWVREEPHRLTPLRCRPGYHVTKTNQPEAGRADPTGRQEISRRIVVAGYDERVRSADEWSGRRQTSLAACAPDRARITRNREEP
jgi:hypothetical protein